MNKAIILVSINGRAGRLNIYCLSSGGLILYLPCLSDVFGRNHVVGTKVRCKGKNKCSQMYSSKISCVAQKEKYVKI